MNKERFLIYIIVLLSLIISYLKFFFIMEIWVLFQFSQFSVYFVLS